MKPKLIYLASPYTHKRYAVQRARATLATTVAARVIELHGHAVFSPITHGHELSRYLNPNLHSHEFWMAQCLPVLLRCDELWVLQVDGWGLSQGVAEEVAVAKGAGIPVRFIQPAALTPEKEASNDTHI